MVAISTTKGYQEPPSQVTASGIVGNAVSRVRGLVEAPFLGTVNTTELFIATGVILVSIAAWSLILYHFRLAAEKL